MDSKIDYTRLSNSELNIKMAEYSNEYEAKRNKIISLVADLQRLDEQYNKVKAELSKRGVLSDE